MTTSLTLRSTKGSALTHDEMDTNLTNLKTTADDALAATDTLTSDKAEATALGVANTDQNMGSFTGTTISDNVTAKAAIQALETAVETKANASAVGVTASAANMGTYTGTTIPDNETAKQNLQSLETAVETKANASALGVTASAANMGTYTGSTITDNQTAKQNIQELETAVEARVTTANLASTSAGLGADLVGLTGHSGYTVLDASLLPGNQSSAGSLMKIDWEKESSNTYPTENEGGIWSADTYAFFAISAEMTSSTVPAPGDGTLTGGPLCAIFAFANNNNSGGDVVAFLGSAVARTNNDVAFGANFIARNDGGLTGTKLVGLEIDVEPATGTTVGSGTAGIIVNMFNIATSAPVLQAGAVGSGTWGNGFITSAITGAHYAVLSGDATTSVSFIDTQNGTFSKTAIVFGRGASQGLSFGPTGYGTNPLLYGDTSNNLIVNMGNGNSTVFKDSGGTNRFIINAFGQVDAPNGGEYRISGTKIIGSRKTGWSVDTGTSKRTANATYSGTAEAAYTQATIQALMDAVRDATQTIKALKDDLHGTAGHGLIGT